MQLRPSSLTNAHQHPTDKHNLASPLTTNLGDNEFQSVDDKPPKDARVGCPRVEWRQREAAYLQIVHLCPLAPAAPPLERRTLVRRPPLASVFCIPNLVLEQRRVQSARLASPLITRIMIDGRRPFNIELAAGCERRSFGAQTYASCSLSRASRPPATSGDAGQREAASNNGLGAIS